MSKITVHVKPTAGGEKLTVEIDAEATVADLKDEVAKLCPLKSDEQRLIYRGQILKNEKTLQSYSIGHDHVLHLVKGRPAGSTTPGAAPAGAAPAAASGVPNVAAGPAAGLLGTDPMGMGALFGGNPQSMQQMMAEASNNPIFQHIMNDPELLRSMINANPAVRDLMDRNPELAQIFNDPAILRQSMQIASNPSLMREHMRNADRALSNIEGMPEGFNTLRRLYENVQEPLLNATTNQESQAGANPQASAMLSMLQGAAGSNAAAAADTQATTTSSAASTTGNAAAAGGPAAPNANPLPNPWASPDQPAGAAGAGAAGVPAGLGAGLPGLGGLAGLGGLGGMPGMGGMANPQEALQMLQQNPAMQNMMRSLMSNPQFLETMINSNPMLRQMTESNPHMRAIMTNPDMMRQMMDPANLQAMMQLQNSGMFNSMLGGAGVAMPPGLFGAGGPGGAGGMPGGNMLDLISQLQGMGLPAGAARPAAVADPETAYAQQLQQLQDMGFYDRQANIAALQATNGNVNAAVERLLSAP
mmetsp:Transcript_13483/g.28849  ORF Transcript_13483/g.28849 Transcript_13483/m.28849 type:complete len:530 (+) Transcript_13483:163-1752(+)